MALRVQDELNNNTQKRSMPFDQYFGEMGITDEQVEQRIALAEDLYFSFLIVFKEIKLKYELEKRQSDAPFTFVIDIDEYADKLADDLNTNVIDNLGEGIDLNRITDLAREIIRVTVDHITDSYFTSQDRAMFCAEDQSNAISNGYEFLDAVRSNKSQKKWNIIDDDKVRKTHREVANKTIGIYELFEVGGSLLAYPGDSSHGADDEEVCGCRCWATYQ